MRRFHSFNTIRNAVFCLFLAVLTVCLPLLSSCGGENGKTMVALKIVTPPDRTDYIAGESFDRAGLTVAVVFSDGTEAQITAYSVHPVILKESDDTVFVSYKDASAPISVTVRPAGSESGSLDISLPDASETESSKPDASSADASSPDVSEPGPDTDGSEDEPVIEGTLSQPVKTVYAAGETFDATGLYLKTVSPTGSVESRVGPDAEPAEPLTAGQTSVDVLFGGKAYPVAITVVPGNAAAFQSFYTNAEAEQKYASFSAQVQTVANRTFQSYEIPNKLPNPHPDGYVSDLDELTDYLDYHLFYGIESVILHAYCGDEAFEQELDRYYYRSKLCASFAAVQYQPLGNGWMQVLFRYYPDDWLFCPGDGSLTSEFLSVPFFKPSEKRDSGYRFARLDNQNGATVWSSDQLVFALANGYDVSPVSGSPAETVVSKAKSILKDLNGDDLTPFQKMYNVALWFVRNVQYDHTGEVLASHVCDFEMEPDQFASRFVSFRAEGPLLYGNSVCYGFAKANTVLLALEGLDVTRVVGKDKQTKGRSPYIFDTEIGAYEEIFSIHSYNYVTVGGKQYLSDPTFAYAGSLQMDADKATWYRNFCVGLSKEDHANVYKDYEPDAVSSSPGYNPGSFNQLTEFTYPSADGPKSPTVRSEQDLRDYIAYLKTASESSSSAYCSACIPVAASAFSQADLQELSKRLLEANFARFLFGTSARAVGGETYYEILILFRN